MSFDYDVKWRAYERQGHRCAACGKALVWENEHRGDGWRGAWEAHHRRPGGSDLLRNCLLLCSNYPNCHFNIGHEGNWHNRVVLYDYELDYLYDGEDW
jgi:ssDNA-binding Zn-finger/Zn-ribbon topoisomerase 1